jgi:hypothetical protein
MKRQSNLLKASLLVLWLVFNLAGCAQTGPPRAGTSQLGTAIKGGGAYEQSQKAIWVDPHGSGENTDMELYMDSQGGGR